MREHECDVAVVGGGLAGTAAALAFARQGCSVRLFERRDLARDPNRGDILHAPTVEVIRQQMGLLGLLEERGAGRLRGLNFEDFAGGLFAGSQIRESWLLNHAEMEAVFLEAAEHAGVVVEADRVRSMERNPDSAGGWLLTSGIGVTMARFVVGGDGADSLTRETLDIPIDDFYEYDNWIVVLHSPTPSWLTADYGWTLLHPEGTVWMLPTTPTGRHRVVLTVRRDEAKEWMALNESEPGARLARRHPGLAELELNKRGGSHVYRIKRTHAASYTGPRAALAGDAVHTTHPAGGQGLNIAIQDSAKLAELIGPLLLDAATSEQAFTEALAEYETVRRPINTSTLQVAHMCSLIAGPGQEEYEQAVEFYSRAATDPNWVWEYMANFGGRVS